MEIGWFEGLKQYQGLLMIIFTVIAILIVTKYLTGKYF